MKPTIVQGDKPNIELSAWIKKKKKHSSEKEEKIQILYSIKHNVQIQLKTY